MSRKVREANESSTSNAVTSTITPRERNLPTCSASASRSRTRSVSDNADWIVAIRYFDCFRIGTAMVRTPQERTQDRRLALSDRRGAVSERHNLVAQQTLGLFDAALEVADSRHLAQVNADVDQGLGDFGR